MIVGLTGKKSHGKDTVGRILVEEHGFVRVSFADALKQSAAALFDVPVETWDKLKNDEYAKVILTGADDKGFAFDFAVLSVRSFLQRYGTEAHRDIFGGSFWVDVVRDKVRALDAGGDSVVITDVRFEEEAALVRDFRGAVVNVYRPQVADEGDTHASEQLPRFDFMLWNGGSIEELSELVRFDILTRRQW